jgi:hypothetical protein
LRRNFLLKCVIEGSNEGKIEVTRRRGRRRKQLLDGLKEKTGYWTMKGATLDRIHWRPLFGRGYETVETQKQTTEYVNCIKQLLFLMTKTMFFVIYNIHQYVYTYIKFTLILFSKLEGPATGQLYQYFPLFPRSWTKC